MEKMTYVLGYRSIPSPGYRQILLTGPFRHTVHSHRKSYKVIQSHTKAYKGIHSFIDLEQPKL